MQHLGQRLRGLLTVTLCRRLTRCAALRCPERGTARIGGALTLRSAARMSGAFVLPPGEMPALSLRFKRGLPPRLARGPARSCSMGRALRGGARGTDGGMVAGTHPITLREARLSIG